MNTFLINNKQELFNLTTITAEKTNTSVGVVEKDFWVCTVLDYLFNHFKYKDYIVFKGGTNLSKVYKLINRFSEDIDIALDWKLLGYEQEEPYYDRSNTQQLKFNEKLNKTTEDFIANTFFPILKNDFEKLLNIENYKLYIDVNDPHTICFDYPKNFTTNSILQVIRIEIGCLAEPIPASSQYIQTYIQEANPEQFTEHDNIQLMSVDSLRTFFEKLTILHREANRVNENYPQRYSRHYYDVYQMILTDLRLKSFENLDLLQKVIDFKKKFYSCNWAKYDEIMQGNFKLIPPDKAIEIFSEDYTAMENMLFGEIIPFDQIIKTIQEYEIEINNVIKSKM